MFGSTIYVFRIDGGRCDLEHGYVERSMYETERDADMMRFFRMRFFRDSPFYDDDGTPRAER